LLLTPLEPLSGQVFMPDSAICSAKTWTVPTAYAARLGVLWIFFFVFAALAIYVSRKLVRMASFVREFRMARITPEELKKKLDAARTGHDC